MITLADLARLGQGAGETAAAVGSAAALQPVSGLAGIWAMLTGQDDPSEAISRVQALGYQPKSAGAQATLGGLARLMQHYEDAKHSIADPVADALGPGAGTAMFTAPDAILSLLPFGKLGNLGDLAPAGSKALQAGKVGAKAKAAAAAADATDAVDLANVDMTPRPELATRYPETVLPKSGYDPGKAKKQAAAIESGMDPEVAKEKFDPFYASKFRSPEEDQVMAMRTKIQEDIDAGNYKPMFDPEARADIPPGTYPTDQSTMESSRLLTDKGHQAALAKYGTPEIRQKLQDMYQVGLKDPGAKNWYAMKQLYDAYVDELGPEKGHAAFKERFADPMAATTAGQDPKGNLMATAFGNFMKEKGEPLPMNLKGDVTAFDLPSPVTGQYIGGNMDAYADLAKSPLTPGGQPKQWNFSGNFQGRKTPTIDKQMMKIFDPSKGAPPKGHYAAIEQIVNEEAAKLGIPPSNLQDVVWSGIKATEEPGNVAIPMINQVNHMIERTSRITGKTPKQVLKGFITSKMPMYSMGGATLGELARQGNADDQ